MNLHNYVKYPFFVPRIAEVEFLLTEMGYYPRGQLKPSEFEVPLDCFMGDHVLPGYIHVLPSDVKEFLNSHLITNHMLVLQVISFCWIKLF